MSVQLQNCVCTLHVLGFFLELSYHCDLLIIQKQQRERTNVCAVQNESIHCRCFCFRRGLVDAIQCYHMKITLEFTMSPSSQKEPRLGPCAAAFCDFVVATMNLHLQKMTPRMHMCGPPQSKWFMGHVAVSF